MCFLPGAQIWRSFLHFNSRRYREKAMSPWRGDYIAGEDKIQSHWAPTLNDTRFRWSAYFAASSESSIRCRTLGGRNYFYGRNHRLTPPILGNNHLISKSLNLASIFELSVLKLFRRNNRNLQWMFPEKKHTQKEDVRSVEILIRGNDFMRHILLFEIGFLAKLSKAFLFQTSFFF